MSIIPYKSIGHTLHEWFRAERMVGVEVRAGIVRAVHGVWSRVALGRLVDGGVEVRAGIAAAIRGTFPSPTCTAC